VSKIKADFLMFYNHFWQSIPLHHEEKKTILKQQNILKAVPHRWNSKKKIIG